MIKKIAVLTGGGCAPGLDPFLESFVKILTQGGYEVIAILGGWEGLSGESASIRNLTWADVEGLVRSGGTSIFTSRGNPFEDKEQAKIKQQVLDNFGKLEVEGLVAFGGDDTLTAAERLHNCGINVISIPKTMDLDLSGTDYSVGFWSYCEAVFKKDVPDFINTLKSHRRVGILEVFGRYSGFTAVVVGITCGACFIALPESWFELDLDQLEARVKDFYATYGWALVVVSEAVEIEGADRGRLDPRSHELLHERKTGEALARIIEKMEGLQIYHYPIEARSIQATHEDRGYPTAFDSFIGFRMGIKTAELVQAGHWNCMLSVRGDHFDAVPLGSFKPRRVITPGSWWAKIARDRNEGKI